MKVTISPQTGKSEELSEFQKIMINSIRARKAEVDAGINNTYVDKTRINALQTIKIELTNRNLKSTDLGKYANYQEQINSLPKI